MVINNVLVVIDMQEGFHDLEYWGNRNNKSLESNVFVLINHWRSKEFPIIHVQHLSTNPLSPLHPSSPGVKFMKESTPLPSEQIVTKSVNSAFIGTNLLDILKSNGVTDLVLIGLTSDHCVSTSARMASNLGFNVTIVSDAVATFDRTCGITGKKIEAQTVHEVNLASLNGEFAIIKSLNEIIQE